MRRSYAWLAFTVLLGVELWIGLFVRDRFVRPYLGDVLVILLLYCLGRGIGVRSRWLALYVTLLGVVAETLQYFHLADRLGLAEGTPLRIMLGSTFDRADLLCYLVGGSILGLWELFSHRRGNKQGAVN